MPDFQERAASRRLLYTNGLRRTREDDGPRPRPAANRGRRTWRIDGIRRGKRARAADAARRRSERHGTHASARLDPGRPAGTRAFRPDPERSAAPRLGDRGSREPSLRPAPGRRMARAHRRRGCRAGGPGRGGRDPARARAPRPSLGRPGGPPAQQHRTLPGRPRPSRARWMDVPLRMHPARSGARTLPRHLPRRNRAPGALDPDEGRHRRGLSRRRAGGRFGRSPGRDRRLHRVPGRPGACLPPGGGGG